MSWGAPALHNRAKVLLEIHGVIGCFAMAVSIMVLPPRLTTGISTSVTFAILPRGGWAAVWWILGMLSIFGLARPKFSFWVLVLLAGVTAWWAVAALWPLFTVGRANVLVFIAWSQIAIATFVVAVVLQRDRE